MGLTLELPPEVVSRLREGATNNDAEAVQRVLIEEVALIADATVQAFTQASSSTSPRRADGLTDEEFDALTEELLAITDSVPPLPDSALTREGIYQDHP